LNRLTVKQLLNAQLPSFTAGPSAAAPVVVPHAGHEVAVRGARFVRKFAEEFPEPTSFHHQTGGKNGTNNWKKVHDLWFTAFWNPGLMRNWECQKIGSSIQAHQLGIASQPGLYSPAA